MFSLPFILRKGNDETRRGWRRSEENDTSRQFFDFVKVQIQSCLSQSNKHPTKIFSHIANAFSNHLTSKALKCVRERETQTYLFSIQLKVRSVFFFFLLFPGRRNNVSEFKYSMYTQRESEQF